eukprot:9536968-Alexandrium_andersonii.AAC.1
MHRALGTRSAVPVRFRGGARAHRTLVAGARRTDRVCLCGGAQAHRARDGRGSRMCTYASEGGRKRTAPSSPEFAALHVCVSEGLRTQHPRASTHRPARA